MTDFDDSEITEILEFDPARLDAVGSPANGTGWLMLKSVAVPSKFGRKLSPKARAAFRANAEAVRQGKRPRKGKVKNFERGKDGVVTVPGPDRLAQRRAKADRASSKRAARAVRAAVKASGGERYSNEIPASGPGEAASILACVTGESGAMCSARTVNGAPCRRPAVAGGRCHLHR